MPKKEKPEQFPEPDINYVYAPDDLVTIERTIARAIKRGGKHFKNLPHRERWTEFKIVLSPIHFMTRLVPLQECGHAALFSLPLTHWREGEKQVVACAICDAADRWPRLMKP